MSGIDMQGTGIQVVKFKLKPTDQAFVVDRAPYIHWQYNGPQEARDDAVWAYVKTRVPAVNTPATMDSRNY